MKRFWSDLFIAVVALVVMTTSAQAAELVGWVASHCVSQDPVTHLWVDDTARPCRNGKLFSVNIILAGSEGETVRIVWIVLSLTHQPLVGDRHFLVARTTAVLRGGQNLLSYRFDTAVQQPDQLRAAVFVRGQGPRAKHRARGAPMEWAP